MGSLYTSANKLLQINQVYYLRLFYKTSQLSTQIIETISIYKSY